MMKCKFILLLGVFSFLVSFRTSDSYADPLDYLSEIKDELKVEWPNNRTINLVFHGHSVPAGYYKTPIVKPFESYPLMVMKALKDKYPYAVINSINTAIGGENSLSGSKRFGSDVMTHNPDILFIDYALNDRGIGLEVSAKSWRKMIQKALKKDVKIILLTPSPDTRVDILDTNSTLETHAKLVRALAEEYHLGLVDSYQLFGRKVEMGDSLSLYMSESVVHPNERGHQLIVDEIMRYFE
ncbi:MAG: SGNH/GDSL hydrolase family protein [Bacteroidota bacterium]